METIPNHTDSCQKARRRSLKGYNPAEGRYIAIVAKRNHRATSTRVTSMVTASIGKAIYAATVRRRLHMNGLNTQSAPKHHRTSHIPRRKHYGVGRDVIRIRTDLQIFKRGSVTAVRYRDKVLEPIVRLYAAAVGPTFVLLDDNARPHRADIVDDYLESEGIARMVWPVYPPLKIFGMPSAMLYLRVSHLQSLLLSWKLLYKKNCDCA
ncbi:transposable element Tcb1 transposase [Trichonephila clavipes]|nr:transposable element Tcb1 transposase [Trichonephila clavipes]